MSRLTEQEKADVERGREVNRERYRAERREIERRAAMYPRLTRLLGEAAEAEGWDTEKWAHWQSDARAALDKKAEPLSLRTDN
jgi:hypothetical protein